MRIKYHYIVLLMLAATALACRKDNFDAPSSSLTGRAVYKGEPIGLEYNQVSFQVYQFGFGKTGPIEGYFNQEGAYSLLLFDGTYKFIVPNGQGPFQWRQTAAGAPDTVTIDLRGNQTIDVEVTPYYMIRTPQFSASGREVTAAFKIDKVITDASARDIENVSLYINKTSFVSGADNIATTNLNGGDITDPNSVTLKATAPAIDPAQGYVYARIGLKIAGVEDRIFSPVVKVNL